MPESFRVQLSDPTKYDVVVTSAFQGAPGVGRVQDQQQMLDKLFTVMNGSPSARWSWRLMMIVCAVLLMATTIRQAAFTRRRETGIMRLVGASNLHHPAAVRPGDRPGHAARRRPGHRCAVGRDPLRRHRERRQVDPDHLHHHPDVVSIAPLLVGGGAVVAMATSWLTLRRYLRV